MQCLNIRLYNMMWYLSDFDTVINISTLICADCVCDLIILLEPNVWVCKQNILDFMLFIYVANDIVIQ